MFKGGYGGLSGALEGYECLKDLKVGCIHPLAFTF